MTFTTEQIIGVCGFITAIAGVYAIVSKPVKEYNSKLAKYDELLANDKKRLDKMEDELAEITSMTTLNIKVQLQLLNHMIDGNGVDKMKEMRKELEQELINR